MRRCEYLNCKNIAYKKILGVEWLCKKHYLIILDNLKPMGAGRKPEVRMENIFKFLEGLNCKKISINQFKQEFKITYPTARRYLEILEKYGFVENSGDGIWKIKRKL